MHEQIEYFKVVYSYIDFKQKVKEIFWKNNIFRCTKIFVK